MIKKKQKTTTRTIRLSEYLDKLLEKDSEDKRMSTNSLITTIVTRYAEWDRYTEKIGFVSLPREAIKLIIDSIDDEKISRLAEEFGSRHAEEYMMFWLKKVGSQLQEDELLDQLALFCRYAGIANCEIVSEERDHIAILHHELGRKWSLFLGNIFVEVMKSTGMVVPKLDITDYSVVFRFFVP